MCEFLIQKKALTFYSQSLICNCNALVLLSFIILPYQTSAFDVWLLTLTSAFTFTFTFVYAYVYVYAYAYAYACVCVCVCPVPLPMPGSVRLCRQFICYVSTHFRYILTIFVLIRNTFSACRRKLVKYCFIRQSCQKTN